MADAPVFQIRRTSDPEDEKYIRALISGEPGTGKTLSSSTWPNPLLVTAEGLIMSLQSSKRDVPFIEISSTDELSQIVKALRKVDQHEEVFGFRVKTLVIDTIDEIADLFLREWDRENKGATDKRAKYGDLKEKMKSLSRALRGLKMNVVLNCHLKSAQTGEDDQYYLPAIAGSFAEEIAGYIDLSAVLRTKLVTVIEDGQTKRVIRRYLQTFPDPTHKFIKDHSGNLPQEFPINFEDDYQRLHGYIFGPDTAEDAAKVKVTPDATTTPVPVVDAPADPALSPELSDEDIAVEIAAS